MIQETGQLDSHETPRGNHVVRVDLLPISLLTASYDKTNGSADAKAAREPCK